MIVTLLTDYGTDDEFAGVCRAVIAGICPDAQIIDLTHGIPPQGVRRGAVVLRDALGYVPAGVHMAVVDPEVGTDRRALALRCGDGRVLVGPDNGLLSLAWERCGGVAGAVEVSRSPHRLQPVAPTFHGRDVFAPVAAHLASGADLAGAGERIDPAELATVELPTARIEGRVLVARALAVDRFGNVALNAGPEEVSRSGMRPGEAVVVEAAGARYPGTFARTFADVPGGEMLVYEDAYRTLTVAVNRGDAARTMGLAPDAELRIARW